MDSEAPGGTTENSEIIHRDYFSLRNASSAGATNNAVPLPEQVLGILFPYFHGAVPVNVVLEDSVIAVKEPTAANKQKAH